MSDWIATSMSHWGMHEAPGYFSFTPAQYEILAQKLRAMFAREPERMWSYDAQYLHGYN